MVSVLLPAHTEQCNVRTITLVGLPATLLARLAVSSRNNGVIHVATFDNVTVTGIPAQPPAQAPAITSVTATHAVPCAASDLLARDDKLALRFPVAPSFRLTVACPSSRSARIPARNQLIELVSDRDLPYPAIFQPFPLSRFKRSGDIVV